jgi:glycine hydroxymethyltransferase
MILCGYSSYPRDYDYAQFKKIADEVGALTMADVSHIGGLIAGGAMRNPCDFGFDFVTTTTHKSMRGPRGGMILCKQEHAKKIDQSVFPGLQGGPHMNAVAGVAITLGKAQRPEFRDYCRQVLVNAKVLAESLMAGGAQLVTGGTGNHMMVLDCVSSFAINGRVAEETLDAISITTNKQVIPDDPNPPLKPSGIRLGTPAATTRGMKEAEMQQLARWIVSALRSHDDAAALAGLKKEVEDMCGQFPVPGIA